MVCHALLFISYGDPGINKRQQKLVSKKKAPCIAGGFSIVCKLSYPRYAFKALLYRAF